MRLAVGIGPRHHDADALPFQHRKGDIAEIEYHVTNVVFRIGGRQPKIAGDRGHRRLDAIEEIDCRLGRGRDRLAADTAMGFRQERLDIGLQRVGIRSCRDFLLGRQFAPGELLSE